MAPPSIHPDRIERLISLLERVIGALEHGPQGTQPVPQLAPAGADLSPLLTTAEAADYLRTTPGALNMMIARGALRPDVWGGRGAFKSHRFRVETLDAFSRRK